MKKEIFAVAIFTSIAIGAIAAPNLDRNTGNPEIKTVKASFPQAKNIHKISKGEGYTEFDFQVNHKNISATYNKEGKLIETDYELSYNELPVVIKESIESNFAHMDVTKVNKVSYRGNVFYKVNVISEGKQYNIAASSDGQVTIMLE